MAMELGVKIAPHRDNGSSSQMKNGENALAIQLMVVARMKPETAIVGATDHGTQLLQLIHILGSVEERQLADLVVGPDPTDEILAAQDDITLAMTGGVVYRNESALDR